MLLGCMVNGNQKEKRIFKEVAWMDILTLEAWHVS